MSFLYCATAQLLISLKQASTKVEFYHRTYFTTNISTSAYLKQYLLYNLQTQKWITRKLESIILYHLFYCRLLK